MSSGYKPGGSGSGYKPSGAGSGRGGSMKLGGIVALAIAVVAVISGIFIYSWYKSYYSDKITPGITINGRDVSGVPAEKLRSDLKKEFSTRLTDISVKLSYEDKNWNMNAADLGADENVDEVVDQAKAQARTGEFSERKAAADKIKREGLALNVMLSLDQEKLRERLSGIAEEVNLKGHNASAKFNPEPEGNPLQKKDLTKSDIKKMFDLTEESAGYTVDVDAMVKKIGEDLQDDYKADQQLIVDKYTPSLTAEELRQSFHVITEFDTSIGGASERLHNITMALSKVNGKVLNPGEEFSFNDTTGPRNKENGYKMAHVIGKDKTLVDDWGGGVCQASTTLYNAALMAGCEVTDRAHHSFPSSYVRFGFDAMVNYPSSDLKFKNNTDLPMYFKAWVKNSKAYVVILGKPIKDGGTIERLSVKLLEGEPPEAETMTDENGDYSDFVKYTDEKYAVRASYPERRVQAWLIYKDKDGKEINRKMLYEDHFNAIKGLWVYGKETRPANTTEPGTPPPVNPDTEPTPNGPVG